MAINLDAIKQKLNSLQNVTTKQNNLWKPEPGTQVVRIVPYQHNRENPFLELYFHYNFGGKSVLSPMSFGRPDPIVEFAEKLKRSGNKEDWKLGKKIEPKFRCFVPVIVRGEEEKGVRFWSFGKQIYQELLGVIADPDYGDITDLMNGRDLTVEHVAAEKEGAFPSYTVRPKPNQTPATTDKEVASKIVNDQKQITELYSELSYEEMTSALEKWLNPDTNADAPAGKSESQIKTATTATKVDDINSAFDELFNS